MSFFYDHGRIGLVTLGLVFLVVTGGEALYADLGHFGRKPIQTAWFGLVLPALLLNYFGQGAKVLADPAAIENPFYRLVPETLLLPMVVLATAATVIASQAVITAPIRWCTRPFSSACCRGSRSCTPRRRRPGKSTFRA